MNKSELVEAIALRTDLTNKDANAALDGMIDAIEREVKKGEKVTIPGFGTFERRDRKARMATNPQDPTGDKIKVKAQKVPAFRPGANFKGVVSGKVKLPAAPRKSAKK